MSIVRYKLVCLLILAILAGVVLAYFGRPRPPRLDLVSPRQELPEYSQHYPGDTKLADRVTKSYGLAMVLVQSPYTDKNVVALEAIRSWARQRFQQEPDFLHPVSLEIRGEPASTMFGALGYSLFAGPWYWIEQNVGNFLATRIEQFHSTRAYASFRVAYFDLFGVDADSADLLAKYQTEKAKQSISVIVWCFVWLAAGFSAVVRLWTARHKCETLQAVLSYGWLLVAFSYLLSAWTDNQVCLLISALLCALTGLYLQYPFVLSVDESKGSLRFKLLNVDSSIASLALWISMSLVAVQGLTWMRIGTPSSPDPITLLLSGVSGNFLQDPADEKRWIVRLVGVFWILLSIWVVSQLRGNSLASSHIDDLASLKGPM
ncbi:MAG: hypothetical protein HY711_01575 [Candidatus Melainabacteria bacterium]|nr:hypothetical protein [Candidatus Melainabacteria bacterium]